MILKLQYCDFLCPTDRIARYRAFGNITSVKRILTDYLASTLVWYLYMEVAPRSAGADNTETPPLSRLAFPLFKLLTNEFT